MKAVIPVAGVGTRLRPHTHTQPKALVPVAGKPILGHLIDSLYKGGVRDFVFVIGYLGSKIEEYVRAEYQSKDVSMQFVIQEPRNGTAHAVWFAKNLLEHEKDFLILLGDSILELDLEKFVSFDHTVLGVKKVDRPDQFGVVELDDSGFVKKLVEKPKIPKSNLALVGIYKIANPSLFFEGLDKMLREDQRTHGEFQLTDALLYMVQKGEPMVTFNVNNWYDCGKKETLLEANAILLNAPEFHEIKAHSYPNTIIIPPVSIGKDCDIQNSIIGPNVAVGDHSVVRYSIVKNTIVGAFSELRSTVLNESVIGNDSSLRGLTESLNIGDNTEINFSSWNGDED